MLIVLGTWFTVFVVLALFVVPLLFAPCTAHVPEP
jgi:hypothetical protein